MNRKPTSILLIALLQGWSLYGLHWSIEHKIWPGTDPLWLVPLYAATAFVPLTLQILAEFLRTRALWIIAGTIGLLAMCLGFYAAWSIGPTKLEGYFRSGASFPFAFYLALSVIWFVALPFAQTWFRIGAWNFPYRDLFEFSWQNALLLFEAGVFTCILWGLLGLWAGLFKVVDISFFADLFTAPAFIYPVTALTFGYAIYLIQSREKIVVTVRRHLLGVFCWLFPLVAAIALLFLTVLPFTGLAPLWKTGHATFLMLWLQTLLILFLNAAFDDGENAPPYPAWLRNALRIAAFSMPIYAALCAYSLGLRIEQHGWTVDRVWAAFVTFVVAMYSVGYAATALRSSPWMGPLPRVNIGMAWVIIASLVLLSTPLLDPKRLSTLSQIGRLLTGKIEPAKFDFDYLHFDLGKYGRDALAELKKNTNAETARLASLALTKTQRWDSPKVSSADEMSKRISMYPVGTAIDSSFMEYLLQSSNPGISLHCISQSQPCLLLAIDLNSDGQIEIVSLGAWPQTVFSKIDGKWTQLGQLEGPVMERKKLEGLLREAAIQTEEHEWLDLRVGEEHYSVREQVRPKQTAKSKSGN